MSLWSLTAAAVLTGLTVGAQQSGPTAQGTPPPPSVSVEALQEDGGQRVSVDFNHAPVSDVLDWLSKNGASFVEADSEIPRDTTITMSIKDQPINEVVDALASALGGHWERNGGVRVFRHGSGGGFGEMRMDGGWSTTPEPPAQFRMAVPPGKFKVTKDGQKVYVTPDQDGGDFKVYMAPGQGDDNFKVFGKQGQDDSNFKVFSDDNGKTFVMPKMPDMKNFQMPDMKDMKDMKNLPDMDKLRAQLKDQLKDVPGMSPEAEKEMMQALKESHDEMLKSGDQMKISLKALAEAKRAMEEAQREHPEMKEEMQKAMEKAQRAMEEARKEHPEAFGDGNTFFMSPPGEKGRTFSFKTQDGSDFGKMGRSFTFKAHDFTKFASSLSPDQKELNRRQGYLRASDLTQTQRQMLGVPADGKGWSITIVKDGDTVTVKGDR